MCYAKMLTKMSTGKIYSRQQIYDLLSDEDTHLSRNSFNWVIDSMIKNKKIIRLQRGMYSLSSGYANKKRPYNPSFSKQATELINKLKKRFPLLDFTCFESVQLNEFLNHLIAQNTCFIMTEREFLESVFRYVQEENLGNVLMKPSAKEWDSYWTGNSNVLLNRVSEAPKNDSVAHGISIEQLLVDIIAEKTMRFLYDESEITNIYSIANKNYQINKARLMRYARRRGKAEEIKKYIA